MPAASAKKDQYILKLIELLKNHPQILIAHADHVGSNQMQQVRKSLRGKATILMGKNTMIRKVIRSFLGQDELRVEGAMEQIKPMEQLERLLPLVKENIGLVFCKTDLNEIRKVIVSNTRPAAAKAGTFAPCDVVVPAGPTGLDPSQTSFFQALNIATKINKGQIEIINNVNLIAKGSKVGSSEVALLGKLDIKPFAYGLTIRNVYDDGSIYSPEVLDLTAEEIMKKFMNGVQNVAAISRAIGFPTAASLPHVLLDGFKNVVACVMGTAYTFKQAEALMNAAKAPAAVAAAPAAGKAAPAAAAAPAKKVEEEEEDMDLGSGGLFGDF